MWSVRIDSLELTLLLDVQMAEQRESGSAGGSGSGDHTSSEGTTTEGEARDANEEEKKRE